MRTIAVRATEQGRQERTDMRIFQRGLITIIVGGATMSCNGDLPMSARPDGTDEVSSMTAGESGRAVVAGVRLPFSGRSEGTFGPLMDDSQNLILCDAFEAGGFMMRLEGTGVMSHLGRITLHTTHCSSADPASGQYDDGWAIYTAANGDELHASYRQLGGPQDPGVETIAGGTGRFHNATGEIRVAVIPVIEFDENGMPIFPGRFTATYDGWISYGGRGQSRAAR
jgi:hypothetical protein